MITDWRYITGPNVVSSAPVATAEPNGEAKNPHFVGKLPHSDQRGMGSGRWASRSVPGGIMTRLWDRIGAVCSISWARAEVLCRDRLVPWLLGDFAKDETGALHYDTTAFKRMKSAFSSGLHSTGKALRYNWYRKLPDKFR